MIKMNKNEQKGSALASRILGPPQQIGKGRDYFHGDLLDNGRRFKVEMQQNKAERYLLVSVMSEDERRYFEFFQRALTFCVGKQ